MTWLDNPLTRMWGPYFLVLYTMVLAVLLALVLWHRRRVDQSMEFGNLPIPSKIDPYQLAYLRGGPPEVLRLATVDLYQRGLIVGSTPDSSDAKRLHLLPEADLADLDPPLRAAAASYRRPRKLTDLLDSSLTVGFEQSITQWDRWSESERLNHSTYARTSHFAFQIAMLVAYYALGIYKLSVYAIGDAHVWSHDVRYEQAFADTVGNLFFSTHAEALAAAHKMGHPAILVFGIGFAMLCAAAVLFPVLQLSRLTERGRRFIADVQTAYASRKRPRWVVTVSSDASQPAAETDNAEPVLATGLFGVEALQGGPLDIMYEHYVQSADAGSSCGPGCGSGDGGGGCGGCGGGGCGCGG